MKSKRRIKTILIVLLIFSTLTPALSKSRSRSRSRRRTGSSSGRVYPTQWTIYAVKVKDRLTNKVQKGFFRYYSKNSKTKATITGNLILYYEERFLSSGEMVVFVLTRSKVKLVNPGETLIANNTGNFGKFEKLVENSGESLSFTNSIEGGVHAEFKGVDNSTGRTKMEFDDMGKITRLYDPTSLKFDYEIIERKEIKIFFSFRVLFYVIIIAGFFCCNLFKLVSKLENRTQNDHKNTLYYSEISSIFIVIACIRTLVEIKFLVAIWLCLFYCFFIGGFFTFLACEFRMKNQWGDRDSKSNIITKIWVFFNILGVIGVFISIKFLPFFGLYLLIGGMLDVFLTSKDYKESNQVLYLLPISSTFFNFIPLLLIVYEFYYPYGTIVHFVDKGHFYIWISLFVILIILNCAGMKFDFSYKKNRGIMTTPKKVVITNKNWQPPQPEEKKNSTLIFQPNVEKIGMKKDGIMVNVPVGGAHQKNRHNNNSNNITLDERKNGNWDLGDKNKINNNNMIRNGNGGILSGNYNRGQDNSGMIMTKGYYGDEEARRGSREDVGSNDLRLDGKVGYAKF